VKIRDDVALDTVALVGCAVLTGCGAVLNTAEVEDGASVAVWGCGGVGLNVVQGARLAGAAQIIAIDTRPDKLELARKLGATDVVDASAGDRELDRMTDAVQAVLAEIGASELPTLLVLNKIDAVDSLGRRRLASRFPDAVQVSALTGEGLDALREQIAVRFAERFEDVRLLLPYDEGGRLADLYALGAPIQERLDLPEGVFVRAHLPRRELRRFARYLVADADEATLSSAS
jgi:hypothetical protein